MFVYSLPTFCFLADVVLGRVPHGDLDQLLCEQVFVLALFAVHSIRSLVIDSGRLISTASVGCYFPITLTASADFRIILSLLSALCCNQ